MKIVLLALLGMAVEAIIVIGIIILNVKDNIALLLILLSAVIISCLLTAGVTGGFDV